LLLPNEDALLRSCSWHAERLFRRDHIFKTITFLTVTAQGSRAMFDTPCVAPKDIADHEAWAGLVTDMRVDFADAEIVLFAVAYRAFHVTKYVDPAHAPGRLPGIAVEVHSIGGTHVGTFREIIGSGRSAYLAAARPPEPADDSIFAKILQRTEVAAA
jgi:hypothetical protein